jgi:hypothetical protein
MCDTICVMLGVCDTVYVRCVAVLPVVSSLCGRAAELDPLPLGTPESPQDGLRNSPALQNIVQSMVQS